MWAIFFKTSSFTKKSSECSTPIIFPVAFLIPTLIDPYLFCDLLSDISLSILFLLLFKNSSVPSIDFEYTTINSLF